MPIPKTSHVLAAVHAPSTANLHRVSARERQLTSPTNRQQKARRGQFFTPPTIAHFMASLFELDKRPSSLLDPGAGLGALSSAFADRWLAEDNGTLNITTIESDPELLQPLKQMHSDLHNNGISSQLVAEDLLQWYLTSVPPLAGDMSAFDFAILNPPYFKISSRSTSRSLLHALDIETSNMYAAFLALTARTLKPNGQLVAITPRSFTNGTYFRQFRNDFFSRMSFATIHSIDERNTAFARDQVLQETIIFHAYKRARPPKVLITTGGLTNDDINTALDVPYNEIQPPMNPSAPIRLPRDQIDLDMNSRIAHLPCTLADLGMAVSTGQIVEFRSRPHLRHSLSGSEVPLLYPRHLSPTGIVTWSSKETGQPIAIAFNEETASQVMPMGPYTVVKRFTAKEERKRIVASSTGSLAWTGPHLAFENHLNLIHRGGRPISSDEAAGLAAFLNSTLVDLYFRQISGHTQINAADLRSLRYPTKHQLESLGRALPSNSLDQVSLDTLVLSCVPDLEQQEARIDYLMAHHKVLEARQLLKELGLPKPQTNERSALTLLATLDLTPDKDWSEADSPLIGITPMMEFMRDHYGKNYAPNSRETVRRQTVHQFVDAGVLLVNPDDPERPTNSGLTVYQVPTELVEVLRTYGTAAWVVARAAWLSVAPSLREQWQQERAMGMIPVALPGGVDILLSPGGQNPLIKALVEQFCARFISAGIVVYIGDAQDKFSHHDREILENLGLFLDDHGKMPDLIVLDEGRQWLFLIEAVTSHGPMDPKRKMDLTEMFSPSGLGLVFVTAFADKKSLSRFLPKLAWETEVWVAENPSHMIHFDGERFLGPYG